MKYTIFSKCPGKARRVFNGSLFFFSMYVALLPVVSAGCRRSAGESVAEAVPPQGISPVVSAETAEAPFPGTPASPKTGQTGDLPAQSTGFGTAAGETRGRQNRQSGGESFSALSGVRSGSGRGVFIGELNPVNYKTVDPAILLQMGMEQYQVSFILGERYLGQGSYDRALSEYNRALALKPDYAEALFSRGRTYQIKGEVNRALEDYNKTIALKRDSAAAYNYRGYIYAQKGDHGSAVSDYTRALALKRDYGDALYNRGYSYRILGQYDRAIEDFTRLLQLEPHNASAHNQRGTAWYYKEKDEEAIRDFSEAIRLKPDYALAWHNRGTVYSITGNTNQAKTDFAEAARLGYR